MLKKKRIQKNSGAKNKGIKYASRCTAMKKETSLWYTFFNGAKFV